MRPIKLTISGLRSYLAKVEIDFGDVNLIAIVGDTGAGKSSILEALFFGSSLFPVGQSLSNPPLNG